MAVPALEPSGRRHDRRFVHHLCRQICGPGIFFGVVEGHPSRESIVENVAAAGYTRVRLAPFMLVAGVHFQEDLAGAEDSWKSAFEQRDIQVALEEKGLGMSPGIVSIFTDHIRQALAVIPSP